MQLRMKKRAREIIDDPDYETDESGDGDAFAAGAAAAGMSAKMVMQPRGMSAAINNNALVELIANADGSRKPDFVLPPRQQPAAAPKGKQPKIVMDGPFMGHTLVPLPNYKWKLDPECAASLSWISSPDAIRTQTGEAQESRQRSKEEQYYRTKFPISPPAGNRPKNKQWCWTVGEWLEPEVAEQRRAAAAELAAAEPEPQPKLTCGLCGAQPGDEGPGGYPLTALDFDTDHDGITDTSATALNTIAARREALASGTARLLCMFCHRRASLKQLHFAI